MRPERLTLSAFGPFAAEQTFDFAELGPARLFLIHGPTGAGKTTLLDALCYALFGTSSGDERQAEHLRSHHAAIGTPTWVELDFRLGPDRYRVRRAPAQPQIGRGGRVVTVTPKVTLWRRDGEALVVLADQERRAAEEIKRLLGYSVDEFRQVVMLPQGRFREVLTARPKDRQEILANLFRTGLYRRIEAELKARTQTALEEARHIEERRRTLLAEASAATPEAAAAAVAALATQRDGAEARVSPLRLTADKTAADLARGQQTQALLQQAAESAAALAKLREREEAVARDRARLTAARRAEATVAADRLHARLHGLAATAAADAAAAAAALAEAERRHDRANEALRDEASRLATLDTGRAELARLDARARAAEAAEKAEAEAAALRLRITRANTEHAEAVQKAVEAQSGLEQASRDHAEAARRAEAAGWLRERLKQARGVATDMATATKLTARLNGLERACHAATQELDMAALALRQAADARAEAERALRAHHAVDLARHLTVGAACPVCGSLDHPAPAFGTGAVLADLDEAGAAEASARTRHTETEAAARKAEADLVRVQDQLAALRPRLPDDLDEAEATRRVTEAEKVAASAEAAERELPALADAVTRAEAACVATAQTVLGKQESLRRLEEQIQELIGGIRALRADAPEEAGRAATLAQAAATLARTIRDAATRLESDRTERASAATARQSAQGRHADETRRAAEAQNQAAEALAEWQRVCAAAGFADVEAARAARLDPERLAALEKSLRLFDDQMSRAQALAEQAREAAAGLVAPDLPALEAADQAAREAAEAAAAEAATLRERHARAAELAQKIAAAEADLTRARSRHDLLRGLSGAAAGDNGKRLSLEGFVLTSILDEALACANEHLSRMLGGRYRVRRRDEPQRANAVPGLDIEVLDDWTGIERPAGTLSGGEGFCAALALALGLADTVQAHAGARRIDTLFIDEGFGALDEDALDTAMDVLDRLQAGDRLVGIISHVGELRSRVAAQLVVQPGPRGSTAGFAAAFR